jgi:hypothetical protein
VATQQQLVDTLINKDIEVLVLSAVNFRSLRSSVERAHKDTVVEDGVYTTDQICNPEGRVRLRKGRAHPPEAEALRGGMTPACSSRPRRRPVDPAGTVLPPTTGRRPRRLPAGASRTGLRP